MLILSSVLILALALVGDFGELIDEVGNKETIIDLGSMQTCDPGNAICSVAQIIDGKHIKFSLSFDQKVKYDDFFDISLKVAGINKQTIRKVQISLSQPEKETTPTLGRFKLLSSRGDEISSWGAEAKIPLLKGGKTDWLGEVKISTLDRHYKGNFYFSVFE